MPKNTDHARRFLGLLFEHKPAEAHVLIWKLANRQSRFFTDLDAAALYAVQESRDVYFGVGLSAADYGAAQRCPADQVIGLAGLWCDLDIRHPIAHAKDKLPPDEAAALAILKAVAVRATLIVRSGYGLQAWWLFKEPWIFADDAERKRAAELSHRWNHQLRLIAHGHGFDVDSVHDLARVLRIPGTYNAKVPDEPKPVIVGWGKESRRYNPSELAELVADLELPTAAAGESHAGDWNRAADVGILIDPDRQPPLDLYSELRRKSRRFVMTLEHQRPDLHDQSCSSYDLALAAITVRHGWNDQQIADLLIFHQRKYPLMTNGQIRGVRGVRDRPRYFQTTIAKARAANSPDARIQRLKSTAETNGHLEAGAPPPDEAPGEEPPADMPAMTPAAMLDELSALLKVKIARIIKHLSDPPLYSIETERGRVDVGEAQNLIEQRALRNRLATVGVYLTKRKEEDWEPIATALLACCEPVETSTDSTFEGVARAWIRDYLAETVTMDSLEEADRGQNPFVKDGALILSAAALRKFLITNNGERNLTIRELTNSLRAIGAKPRTHFFQTGEQKTSRSLWELPGKPLDYQ